MIEFFKSHWFEILTILNYILALSVAITLLAKNITPAKTYTYIILLAVLPFIGLIIYFLFGRDYRKQRVFSHKGSENINILNAVNSSYGLSSKDLSKIEDYLDDNKKLVQLLNNNFNSRLTQFNKVEVLHNGENKFAALLKDIENAKHHIHLEYYIFMDDTIGERIIEALCKKAQAGVNVRITIDAVGSKIRAKNKRKMYEAGVDLRIFMPVYFPRFTGRMNYRNHRKIVVIDGTIGYVGGINIADRYINTNPQDTYWRDTSVRISGEAVRMLQLLFYTTWKFVSDKTIAIDERYFPEIAQEHKTLVQIAASGPDTIWANIMEALFVAITNAEDYIYITTPYFIPNDEMTAAICVAARSGIDVRLLVPYASDSWVAESATNSYISHLLKSDVKVYRYTKGFIHAKTMVIDDVFASVGTANFDYRSFNINFECNIFMFDDAVSKSLKQDFFNDLEHAEQVTLASWQARSNVKRIKESVCRLAAPLL